MMEQLYALGVSCIEFVQYWFADYSSFFEVVNHVADPAHVADVLFPLVSIVDSVFAAQLLLCISFGGWLNAVMKWWFLEDRPYWWVQETTFYADNCRPVLRQTCQSCETGPGCPSGHSSTAAMVLLLSLMWISHVMNDRKCYVWWWKYAMYPVCALALTAVILARLFVATHFPHQCLIGALVGSFLAPALCIYVTDPYIWRYGFHSTSDPRRTVAWHVFSAVTTVLIAVVTYLSLVMSGRDPQWTVKLAYRCCENPDSIRVSSTPMYALVHSTATLLGWALCVTPAVAEYRHYTKNRSLLISMFATSIIWYGSQQIHDNTSKDNPLGFYAMLFILSVIKPILLLRIAPTLAMWPYSDSKSKVE